MSSLNEQNSSDNENLCVLCFKNVDIYSVGICDHPVCYECSTRMRILCKQNECPICRADMPKVIFTNIIEQFTSLFYKYSRTNLQDVKFGLIFASRDIENAYYKLLEHRCSICPEYKVRLFKTFGQLKDHMRREHELFYCDICVDNVRIFTSERKTYTRQGLGIHRRKGDPDNTSHRGHPLCEFCDQRFLDSDELFRHLRRIHYFCHICDTDGKHLYYKSIEDLQKHFRDEHYLCEEGDCKYDALTAAFRTEIDLKAHIAAIHGRFLSKNASKQVRTLELAFTLAPRNSRKKPGDEEGAVGYEPEGSGGGGQDRVLTSMDFPALAGSSVSAPPITFPSKPTKRFTNDFPSLGGSNSRPSTGVTITSRNSEVSISSRSNNFPALGKPSTSRESRVTLSVHKSQDSKPSQVSIQVNHKPNVNVQITNNQKSVEQFPALGGKSKNNVQQPQWVQVKSKKQQPEKVTKVAPAPQLPPSDLSQFPNLSKGKLNKKTSSIQVPVSNNWVNLNNFGKEQNKDKKKETQTEINKKKKENSSNEENFEPIETNNNKNKNETVKPPPGFSIKPPPGFDQNNFPSLGFSTNDLTFTTSSGHSYSITSTSSTNNNIYKQPLNFTLRNQNIIKKLSMVSGNDIVNEFKLYSEMFRNNQLSSDKYYDYCKKVLGSNFDDFFPEMLVLLPDIKKQQELYKVHNGKTKKNLLICENCKQVIMKKELQEHYKYHTFENQFTTQKTKQVNNNTWN